MKYNITEIMQELRPGHLLIDADGKEIIFIEAKKVRALVADRQTGKRYAVKGIFEVTPEIDSEWSAILEEEGVNEFLQYRRVHQMKNGQHFIGEDGQEYIFKKISNTTVYYTNADGEIIATYKNKITFIKDILGKITKEGVLV